MLSIVARIFIPAYMGQVLTNMAMGGGMSSLIRSVAFLSLLALGRYVYCLTPLSSKGGQSFTCGIIEL